ncbi:hypothetical protein CXG81DRAFT_25231 [Caulochytrium protostelioides]|uniref:Uncharacterized protein n=1 Tax=Caulochytrium protostelioides TaxID=1555241 RepID=A0A4P9X9T6_9FUNG|nr:hypothetical protein CXG81DRAFT_25231 [Caulochytrium protostelioides]|eukprot:RKP02076.1 hypothetical protein CXG81DRAFT_25231 [Caulochytrium protostelioides]
MPQQLHVMAYESAAGLRASELEDMASPYPSYAPQRQDSGYHPFEPPVDTEKSDLAHGPAVTDGSAAYPSIATPPTPPPVTELYFAQTANVRRDVHALLFKPAKTTARPSRAGPAERSRAGLESQAGQTSAAAGWSLGSLSTIGSALVSAITPTKLPRIGGDVDPYPTKQGWLSGWRSSSRSTAKPLLPVTV